MTRKRRKGAAICRLKSDETRPMEAYSGDRATAQYLFSKSSIIQVESSFYSGLTPQRMALLRFVSTEAVMPQTSRHRSSFQISLLRGGSSIIALPPPTGIYAKHFFLFITFLYNEIPHIFLYKIIIS